MKIKAFLLLLFCLSLLAGCKEDVTVVKNDGPVDFQMTKEEEAATAKWKDKSMDKLSFDALKGDRGALYMQGMCILMGYGWPIDTELANNFFSKSASLGFAPALDQLRLMYASENMPFLAMIYLNLTISEGHQEFLTLYHEIRSTISTDFGPKIAQEIERIAIRKKALIQKNNEALKKCSDVDKSKFFVCTMKNITDEDLVFDIVYWEKIQRGITPTDTEIFCLMIDRNAQKAKADIKRLEAYGLGSES